MSVAEARGEIVCGRGGALSRYIDVETAALRAAALNWQDLQQTRKALDQRGCDPRIVEAIRKVEDSAHRKLNATLRRHPLWPWLRQFPGLGGAHTAIVIAAIGDPRRFPGRRCTEGCYHPSGTENGADIERESEDEHGAEVGAEIDRAIGAFCPTVDADGNPCPGRLLPPRPGSGVRSAWHYLGVHVADNGRSPRKTRGQVCTWNPQARSSILQPDGIADQIIKHQTAPYVATYYAAKERLQRERGAETTAESENASGAEFGHESDAPSGANGRARTDGRFEIEAAGGLRPFRIHNIARTIAAKQFIGDLLVEWKRLASAGFGENGACSGGEA